MKAKKFLAMFLSICMIISAVPITALMSVSADGTLNYKMVKLTSYTKSNDPGDKTVIKTENTGDADGGNVSTTNGAVAVYSVDFGTSAYDYIQIYYAGKASDNKVPAGASINIYLGDYISSAATCTLLANVKVPPYSSGWDARQFSDIVQLAQSLTGSNTISLQFVGASGYSAVSNARQMFFFQNTQTNLKGYVDASGCSAVSGSNTKKSSDNEGVGQLFNGYTDSKFGINWSSGNDVTVYYSTYVPVTIDYYTYLTANDEEGRDPKAWKLYGSTDGVNYTEIDSVSDFTALSSRRTFSGDFFQVDNPGAYQYYKWVISAFKATDSSLYAQVSELSLFGSAAVSATDAESIKTTFNDIAAIAATEACSDAYYTAIETANTAYEALSTENKAYVTNYADLETALNIYNAKTNVSAEFASAVYTLMEDIDAMYPLYNHSDTVIATVQTEYDTMCNTYTQAIVDPYVTNLADLTNAPAAYADHMANFSITVTGTSTASNYPWISNFSDDDWTASKSAIVDEVKYQYENGVDLGGTTGSSYSLGNDEGSVGIQLDSWSSGRDTDNSWNPWNHGGRYWAKVSTPFAGMAFTRASYFAINGYNGDSPIGESFVMDGKTYQLYFSSIRSYDGTTNEKMSNSTTTVGGDTISVTKTSTYPGSGTYSATIGNVFRYFAADYNQTNKYTGDYTTGKNIGIPTADANLGGLSTYYQRFNGPDGVSYILTNSSILGTVTLSAGDAGYEDQLSAASDETCMIGDTMATAIDGYTSIDGTATGMAGLLKDGGDLISADSTTLEFAYGTYTVADGYTQTATAQDQADAVDALIEAIGTVSLAPSVLSAITTAETAYAALSVEAQTLVTNYETLTAARSTYTTLDNTKSKVDNSKYVTTVSGPKAGNSEGYEKAFDGNTGTKLLMNSSENTPAIWYVDTPVKVVAYGLTTGGDTAQYSDRNPQSVTLYGSNDEGQTWTQIDYQSSPNMPAANTTEKVFYVSNSTAYQYYKIAFSNATSVQLSEISLYSSADYSEVMDAVASIPGDLSGYTDESVSALNDAKNAVDYGSDNQATVDGYASAITTAISNLAHPTADYSAVTTAIAAIPADLSVYTDATVAAVNAAKEAVVYNLATDDQATVDAYATAINDAVANLILKTLELNISISEGMVTESTTTEGKYDITWNATITTGENATIAGINASDVVFKEYGVYYATSANVLADYTNASAEEIRQKIFGSSADITDGSELSVYTMFGFRLKNVPAEAQRAAMFYVEYEYNDHTYIVLSTIDETIATIAVD